MKQDPDGGLIFHLLFCIAFEVCLSQDESLKNHLSDVRAIKKMLRRMAAKSVPQHQFP